MMRLHVITTGPQVGMSCVPCLVEHTHCPIDDCKRPHMFLLDEEDMAGLVRTGKPDPKFSGKR